MEKKKSSRDIVTKRITEMILTGQLKPDDQLPPERELASSMGISRNMCSDIIRELEKKGLLVVIPRQGVFVNDFRKNGNMHTLSALMKADFELQPKEIASIIEFKWGIESLACKRVIQNATDEEISRLGGYLDDILDADTPKKAALCAYQYYHELGVLSGNSIVPMLIAGFKKSTVGLWTRYAQNYGTHQLYKSLAEVYFYINKRDLDGAIKQISQVTTDAIEGDYSVYKVL